MNRNRYTSVIAFLCLGWQALAQPVLPWNEKSQLTVLNARHGSRLSLSFVSKENTTHTGNIGMDNDNTRDMLVAVRTAQGTQAFRTGGLPDGVKLLANQQVAVGLTHSTLTGKSQQGIEATFKIVSPFTPCDSLGDVDRLKTQTAPLFYLVVTLNNTQAKAQSGELLLGFGSTPYDRDKELAISWWKRGINTQTLYFKDVADKKSLLALSSMQAGTKHFDLAAYNGLAAPFALAPKESKTYTYIYAGHHEAPVMTDLKRNVPLTYYYNRWFKDISDVLAYGEKEAQNNLARSERFEAWLANNKATPEEKWVAAIAFHSDLANSMLLQTPEGKPGFYLTEGRFRHMNTIDVAHETELQALFSPWRLKLQLEQWTDYIATKEVMVPSGRSLKGIKQNIEGVGASELGPYLYHDIGNFPYVMPAEGYDFGPFMPIEENSNFSLLLYWYWKLTKDDAFVKRHLGLLDVLMQGLRNRDGNENGLADVGAGWSTYDVSEAIKRAPDNVYLGVREAAALVCAAEMFQALPQLNTRPKNAHLESKDEDGNTLDGTGKAMFEKSIINNSYLRKRQAERCLEHARLIVNTIQATIKTYGYLPVSLDTSFTGWNQRSIVICEGLFLPGLAGNQHPLLKELAATLAPQHQEALKLSTTPYGVKLSSGEEVTWFSKVMVSDAVSHYWFNKQVSHAIYTYNWNKNNYQAYQDGAFSLTKEWPGNWYPRGLSSWGYLLRDDGFKAAEYSTWLKNWR